MNGDVIANKLGWQYRNALGFQMFEILVGNKFEFRLFKLFLQFFILISLQIAYIYRIISKNSSVDPCQYSVFILRCFILQLFLSDTEDTERAER